MPFTLAVEIAALVAAADFTEEHHELEVAEYCHQTADIWNDSIERWNYMIDTPLAATHGRASALRNCGG